MLTDIIQQQWLSKNESKAYLAVLELGVSPVSRIARKIDERRENTYHILEELEKKWFIRSVIMNKITHYSAISPEELLDIQQWKIKSLMWIMPQLTALWSWGENKPKVSLFDWSEWLKFLYEDTIKKEWSEIKAFLWYTNADKDLQKYLNSVHLKEREKNNVVAKILMPISMKKGEWYEPKDSKNKNKYTEIKYIPDEQFTFANEIDLYDNKIWIMLYGTNEMFWLMIESKSIYDMLASLFDLFWRNGESQ
jgi:sugar-specific transcriptional regulator TrmB